MPIELTFLPTTNQALVLDLPCKLLFPKPYWLCEISIAYDLPFRTGKAQSGDDASLSLTFFLVVLGRFVFVCFVSVCFVTADVAPSNWSPRGNCTRENLQTWSLKQSAWAFLLPPAEILKDSIRAVKADSDADGTHRAGHISSGSAIFQQVTFQETIVLGFLVNSLLF